MLNNTRVPILLINTYLSETEAMLQWRYPVSLLYKKGENPPKHCTFDVNQISSTFPIYQLYKICIANNIWSPQDRNVKRELPRGV